MSLLCEFCKNTFTSKSNLNYHQKNAKFCLELRGKTPEEYICQFCNKSFYSKVGITNHISICTVKETSEIDKIYKKNIELEKENINYKKDIENKNEYIKKLEEKVEKLENHILKIAEKPTTTTNNTLNNNNNRYQQIIQNLMPITSSHFEEIVEKLSEEHVINGVNSYVDLSYDILKDKAVCTDLSRKMVKYKDEKGEVISDPKLDNFVKKFFNSIKDKNSEIIQEYVNNLVNKLEERSREFANNLEIDESDIKEFDREFEKILDKKDRAISNKIDIDNITKGHDNTLKFKYVEKMCNKLYLG